ncbi:sensor histidine kinase [Brevundimonas sp. Root1279]|uniref:sensor histidine kinase n=1 Tax=Brevundimonas sp. Root1279 TaxID=1736443 RepID=UPI000701E182|nr:sensor histidine kinase [Brevundimonas sp. Root1279]KQW79759.1 hypothetical protein ASC65_14530 [Brevundimonas sp. Root1279]
MSAFADRPAAIERRLGDPHEFIQILVGIRLRTVTDPESIRHLTWLSDIVAALALIQRRLPGEGSVDFAAYLDDVAAFWARSCADRGIRLEARGAKVEIPDGHVLPLAMILHELIANAVRHGFPDSQGGLITVLWAPTVDGVSLLVRDSGLGAGELAPRDGLSLVRGLAEHLGGAMTVETAPGAGAGVRIRLPLDTARTH